MAERKVDLVHNAQFCTSTLTVVDESVDEVEAFMKVGEHAPGRNAFLVRIPLHRVSAFVELLERREYVHQGYQKRQRMHVFYRWFNSDLPCGIPQLYTARMGVTVAVVDREHNICLITERNPDNTPRFKGKQKWISGAVNETEDCYTAATREVEEEIGLPPSATLSLTVIAGYRQAGDDLRDVSGDCMDVLLMRLRGRVRQDGDACVYQEGNTIIPLIPDLNELASIKWVSTDELRAMDPATVLNPEWNDQLLRVLNVDRLPELELKLDVKKRRVDILPCA